MNSKVKLMKNSLLILSFFAFTTGFSLNAQVNQVKESFVQKINRTKNVRIGYGGVFSGSGDMWGKRLLIGTQFPLSKHNYIDLRLTGSLIKFEKDFHNNPDWHVQNISTGLDLVLDYNFILQTKKFRFYPSIGPAIRYSYEKHFYNYGITYNYETQDYDWHYTCKEDTGFRFGYVFGVNFDYFFFKRFRVGPRFSVSQFPKDGYIFSFVGVTITK